MPIQLLYIKNIFYFIIVHTLRLLFEIVYKYKADYPLRLKSLEEDSVAKSVQHLPFLKGGWWNVHSG